MRALRPASISSLVLTVLFKHSADGSQVTALVTFELARQGVYQDSALVSSMPFPRRLDGAVARGAMDAEGSLVARLAARCGSGR